MSQVELLYRFQQTDNEIRADKLRLAEVIRLQKETVELLSARKEAQKSAAKLQKWRVKQNDLNLELSGLNAKAKRTEDRLYSGLVKNPKELADLQLESEALGRRRSVLEDELLDAMIMAEEAQEEDEAAQNALADIQAKWEQQQQKLGEEQAQLVKRLQELAVLNKQQMDHLGPDALVAYNRTAGRVGIVVVAALTGDRCQGCLVKVPSYLVKAADEGQLVNCDSCGRILYSV